MGLWQEMMKLRAKGKKEPKKGQAGGSTPGEQKANGEDFTEAELEAMEYGYVKRAPGRQDEIERLRAEQKKRAQQTN